MQGPEFLIPITFFGGCFGIAYVYFTTRHRERMSLIEKGADPTLFQSVKKSNNGNGTLKFGLLLVGVALGILMGSLLHEAMPKMHEETANFSMIFLFGGIALLVSHFLEAKRVKKE